MTLRNDSKVCVRHKHKISFSQKIIVIFLVFKLFSFDGFAFCEARTDCEAPILLMINDVSNSMDKDFKKLNDKIDEVSDKYKELNKELDKEIYLLQVTLKGESLLYKKLSEIELYSSQSKELNKIDIILLVESLKLIKKGKK